MLGVQFGATSVDGAVWQLEKGVEAQLLAARADLSGPHWQASRQWHRVARGVPRGSESLVAEMETRTCVFLFGGIGSASRRRGGSMTRPSVVSRFE